MHFTYLHKNRNSILSNQQTLYQGIVDFCTFVKVYGSMFQNVTKGTDYRTFSNETYSKEYRKSKQVLRIYAMVYKCTTSPCDSIFQTIALSLIVLKIFDTYSFEYVAKIRNLRDLAVCVFTTRTLLTQTINKIWYFLLPYRSFLSGLTTGQSYEILGLFYF